MTWTRRSHRLVLALAAVLLGGCADSAWYRAIEYYSGIIVFRAGLDDDSCLLIYVGSTTTYPPTAADGSPLEPISQIDVGESPSLALWATELDIGADRCGVLGWNYEPNLLDQGRPLSQGAGSVSFADLPEPGVPVLACTVELEASIEGWILDASVPVINPFCELPPTDPADIVEVDVLGASSPRTRDDLLALRSWDAQLGICYGLDFELHGYVGNPELSMPEGWTLTDAKMVLFGTEEDCRLGDERDDPEAEINPVLVWGDIYDGASGELRFDRSQPWINPNDDTPTPCEVSVDLTVDFAPMVHWSPTKVRFVDQRIPVAKTCGQD